MMIAPSAEEFPELAAGVQLACDFDCSTRTLADWDVVWSPRSSRTMSDMASAVLWLWSALWLLLAVQGMRASRNWLLGPVSSKALPLLPGPFCVPPNWLAGGLPPSSSGSAVEEVPLPEALALVWLSARMLPRTRA